MSYPIWIAARADGEIVIGKKEIDQHDKCCIHDTERVYGSQIPHRVTIFVDGRYKLVTPTQKREMLKEIREKLGLE